MAVRFSLLVAFVLLLTAVEISRAETKISTQSFVIFNTKCASCHEGQCSARMCFEMDSSGAAVHIRNYAGDISGKVRLFLLEISKPPDTQFISTLKSQRNSA